MKSTLATSLSLLGLASARPAPADTPVRTLPPLWGFEITSLEGPGCPDKPNSSEIGTRLTFGSNTVDGSEIYYWFLAYPSLNVELGKTESVWCETELKYTEYKDIDKEEEGEDYRLRLHKNGTAVISTYELDDDVKATFSFTYLDADVTDTYVLNGPAATSDGYGAEGYLVGPEGPPYKESKCGAATLKFRTELTVEGSGKKGVVASEIVTDDDGEERYYGTQLGFSYDWEEC
ncbi:hypothetical protein GGS20DRAFT_398896 [Poronia punctata]|nr:hypothetical protein GGS20DRAFT_398896 [Poronia punctata]